MNESKPNTVPVIFCEMCPEEDKKPARKTCMKCEVSMCVQHLQAHLTTPVLLQTHPLTEPMAPGAATKCLDHGKLVEYYCLDDLTCVCVSCAIEDQHRLHNMKTFSTAHKELLEKLSAEQKELLFRTDDDSVSLEKWETNEREKVTKASVRLIEAISNLRDLTLASVKTSVSARMVSLQTSKNSIQAAQNQKDTYRFLQLYSQVHQDVEKAKAVDLRKGLEPGPELDKLIEEINSETIMEQAEDFCGSLLKMVDPENHQKISYTYDELFFEPETLSSGISLSADKREVFFTSRMGAFSATLRVQSTSARFDKYIINLPPNYDWIVGLCNKHRHTDTNQSVASFTYAAALVVHKPENEVIFGLSCESNKLSILISQGPQPKKKQKVLPTSSQFLPGVNTITIEVVWASPVLSFYSRSGIFHKTLIYSLEISPNDPDLEHFVKLGKDNVQFNPMNQWKCSCGTNHHMNIYNSTSNNCGKCGAIIGGISTTELICWLV